MGWRGTNSSVRVLQLVRYASSPTMHVYQPNNPFIDLRYENAPVSERAVILFKKSNLNDRNSSNPAIQCQIQLRPFFEVVRSSPEFYSQGSSG